VLGSGTLPLLELREGRRGTAAGARDAGVLCCVSGGARVAGSGVVCGMGGSGGAVDCGGGLRRGLRRDVDCGGLLRARQVDAAVCRCGGGMGGCGGAAVRRMR
jgi:hypothetical protein